MGFHGVCGSIGQVFVPSVAVLLAIAIGWRFSFMFFGILSVLVSIYFSRIPSTKRMRRVVGVRSAMFRGRRFWILLGYNIMMGLYFRGTELFLPAYLTKVRGLSIEVSGLAVSLLLAFGVLGQFLGGVAGDRIGSAKALLLESIVLSAGFAFLQFEGLIAATIFLILFGVAFYATQPTTNALAADVSSPEQRGIVYGIMFFIVFGLGSVSSMVAGRAAELSGLQLAFSVMFLFSLIALGASIILSRVWGAKVIAGVAPADS
jgi:MFS family permease